MNYPQHLSPKIIYRHWPLVQTALDKFPEAVEFENPFDNLSFATFVARTRDTLKAISRFDFEHIELSAKDRQALSKMVVKTVENGIAIGPRKSEVKKPMVDIAVKKEHSEESVKAIGTLLQQGMLEQYLFDTVPIEDLRRLLPECTLIETPEGVLVYE